MEWHGCITATDGLNLFTELEKLKEESIILPDTPVIPILTDADFPGDAIDNLPALTPETVATNPPTIATDRMSVVPPARRCRYCGLWQDSGIPCRHFLVCLQKWKDCIEFRSLLSDSNCLPPFCKYKALQHLYKPNMDPVVVDTIDYDGKTMPPPTRVKRQAGRPKVKRYQRRSELSDPSESPIVCYNCGERGHNCRTCKTEANKDLPLAAVIGNHIS
jgi:hypothetical protein